MDTYSDGCTELYDEYYADAYAKAYLNNRARRYLSTEYKVGFIFVFNNYDHDELDQILKSVETFEKSSPDAFVAIYQNEEGELTPLYETSLKKAFPVGLDELGF